MSPSIIQVIPFHFLTSYIAVSVDLLGLKPCEVGRKIGSNTDSKIIFKTCCTILSLAVGIPITRVPPFGLGTHILDEGLKVKVRSFIS